MSDLESLAKGTGADARQARRTLKRRGRAAARGSSEADDFAPLIDALDDLTARLEPGERKRLASTIATDVRKVNAQRIHANLVPDGGKMVPRKAKPSGKLRSRRLRDGVTRLRQSVKEALMFRRATAPRFLRKEGSQGGASVGFVGAMARIMNVHQYGLRDTVTRDASSPSVTYPARPVLGLTPDDRLRILSRVEEHLD